MRAPIGALVFDILWRMLAKASASSQLQRSPRYRFGYHFAMDTVPAENLIESHEYCGDELVRRAKLERRIYERKSIALHAKVTLPGMSVLPGHTVDISRAGASITVPFELAHGQQCFIDLQLQACGESSAFHIPGEVRYCVQMAKGRFRAGIRFGEIDSATSALIAAILKAPV